MIPSPAESKRFVNANDEKFRARSTADRDRVFGDIWNLIKDPRTLRTAYLGVTRAKGARTPGVDGITCADVERRVGTDWFIKRIHDDLTAHRYAPAACLEIVIDRRDGRGRILGVPTLNDRTVQRACVLVLRPILDPRLHQGSAAYMPGRGQRYALKQLQGIAKDPRTGAFCCFDVRGYFDNIDHVRLMRELRRHISDHRALSLVETIITSGKNGVPGSASVGLIQGGPLSNLLANVYRGPLDAFIAAHPRVVDFVAYGDDIRVGVEGDAGVAAAVLDDAARFATNELGLTFSSDKTRIVSRGESLEFLGGALAWGETGTGWLPSARALARLTDNLRAARSSQLINDDNKEDDKTQKTKHPDGILSGFTNYFAQVADRQKVEALAREALDTPCRDD